jgi:hypothetical protein
MKLNRQNLLNRMSAGALESVTPVGQPCCDAREQGGAAAPPYQGKRLPNQPARRTDEHGVALVITLVMLSVTLVMAIAFLALARRERGSVSTATDTTTAKLAADSALAAAQSRILANLLATNDGAYNFGLLVSTNFFNPLGFTAGSSNPTNVNYGFYLSSGAGPLAPGDFEQNVANLKYLPRVPVFVQTNPGYPLDFRFYLDLNRNGQFDDSGNDLPNILQDGTTNGFGVSATGDPQWVGILSRPDLTHSANNPFLARYAFMAVPIGNGLDINAIHNQPSTQTIDTGYQYYENSAYLRNEGVGSWEINLAAFLADLNTNEWDVPGAGNEYQYNEPGFNNQGAAFDDALSILSHRYNYTFNSLSPLSSLFGYGGNLLQDQPFDLTLTGVPLTGTGVPFYANNPGFLWHGSDNTNHYYDLPSEIFNPTETSPNFTRRLLAAGTQNGAVNPDTYDRYTYYRLLAQLGTDSDPDDGKMNLNFRNVTNGVVVPGMETNCFAWSPIEFFTNAADRMLRMYTTNWFGANPAAYLQTYYGLPPGSYIESYTNAFGMRVTNDATGFGLTNFSLSPFLGWTNVAPVFGVDNIPVYVNGRFVYSSAVNRVLQLAANLYDASTTNFYPSVFRPVFQIDQYTNLFIIGYTNVTAVSFATPASDIQFSLPYDVSQLGSIQNTNLVPGINVYGVPWIIGAKANLPGFNQLAMLNMVQANRVLQVGRKTPDGAIYTNHLYELSISNLIGASFWNSYTNDYYPQVSGNNISVIFSDYLTMAVSNSDTTAVGIQEFTNGFSFTTNVWPGSKWTHNFGEAPPESAFLAAYYYNTYFSNIVYKTQAQGFYSLDPNIDPDPFESNNFACDLLPAMSLITTNWMRAIIVDSGHVIDYVQLRGPTDATNFTAALNDPDALTGEPYLWATNAFGGVQGPSYGYVNQISISQGIKDPPVGGATWNPVGYPGNANSVKASQAYFKAFFQPAPHAYTDIYSNTAYATNPVVQAGYTATRTVYVPYLYQVNDPLVHYTADDLNAGPGAVWEGNPLPNGVWRQADGVVTPSPVPTPPHGADAVKGRYQPWGAAAPTALQTAAYDFGNAFNSIYKDPGVWDPDFWNFPTNKYPAVGWIGRVHRGTPWQTVYLKALNLVEPYDSVGSNTWAVWTGDVNNLYDAANSAPVQDRMLFDLFTTRPNDNAARGTLSVNQTNLAAWSAVLSGVVVLTNLEPLYQKPNTLYPAKRLATMLPKPTVGLPFPIANNSYNIIQPAGVAGDSSPLARLVAAINSQRANPSSQYGFTNGDGVAGAFEHVGDILSVPQLTDYSAFLNTNNVQQAFGVSDAEYEWLPQQVMGLLRGSSTPRYVIYGYGQSLRPAPNGLVGSNPNFGLVTNYQVVAESGVRAVVSVHRQIDLTGAYPVTNYTTRVESYNVLPSD